MSSDLQRIWREAEDGALEGAMVYSLTEVDDICDRARLLALVEWLGLDLSHPIALKLLAEADQIRS